MDEKKEERQLKAAISYYERQFNKCQHVEAREMALDDVACRYGKDVKIAVRKATDPETIKAEGLE